MFFLYKPFQKSLRFKIQNLETLVKKKFFLVCGGKYCCKYLGGFMCDYILMCSAIKFNP